MHATVHGVDHVRLHHRVVVIEHLRNPVPAWKTQCHGCKVSVGIGTVEHSRRPPAWKTHCDECNRVDYEHVKARAKNFSIEKWVLDSESASHSVGGCREAPNHRVPRSSAPSELSGQTPRSPTTQQQNTPKTPNNHPEVLPAVPYKALLAVSLFFVFLGVPLRIQ